MSHRFPRQTCLMIPGSKRRPSAVLTIDEVLDAIKNFNDIQLAHEIAVNPRFRLLPYKPPGSSLENRPNPKSILNEDFWDHLHEQLYANPPIHDKIIILIGDIKEVNQTRSPHTFN